MPEGGWLHYGAARGTFAFQLLLSRELLKNGLGKILHAISGCSGNLCLQKGFRVNRKTAVKPDST